jgi:hypothetical protein
MTLALALGLSLLMGTTCFATTVEPVSGDLQINRPGQGFRKVSESTIVNPGDLLMVSPNGTANVFYPDGCKYVLQPGAVLTVAAISPCASKSFAQGQAQEGPPPPPGGPPFGDAGAWGFGAAVLGLTGFVGYEISQSGKTTTPKPRPASP